MGAHTPQRRCIGCGRVAPKDSLVRLALADGLVARDEHATRPGRGAYICHGPDCLTLALARKRLARAFRGRVEVSAELVESGV